MIVQPGMWSNVGTFFKGFCVSNTAKPACKSEGSAHPKNIPTNSSGDGVIAGGGFFFKMLDMTDSG